MTEHLGRQPWEARGPAGSVRGSGCLCRGCWTQVPEHGLEGHTVPSGLSPSPRGRRPGHAGKSQTRVQERAPGPGLQVPPPIEALGVGVRGCNEPAGPYGLTLVSRRDGPGCPAVSRSPSLPFPEEPVLQSKEQVSSPQREASPRAWRHPDARRGVQRPRAWATWGGAAATELQLSLHSPCEHHTRVGSPGWTLKPP